MTLRRTLPTAVVLTVLVVVAGCSDDPAAPAAPTAAAPTTGGSAPGTGAPPETGASDQAPPSSDESDRRTDLDDPVTLDPLTGRATTLTIDRRAVDVLGAVGVELGAVAPARLQSSGSDTDISFDVTGGSVTADPTATSRLTGEVQHAGGLLLSAFGRSVTVDEFVVDADEQALTAEVAGRRLPLLPLDLADARLERDGEVVVVTDDAVSLHPEAARAVAEQLGLPALPSFELGRLQVALSAP